MSIYPEKVSIILNSPRNAGKAKGANAVGTNGCFGCGGVLRLSLRIDSKTKEIRDAKFQTNGCGYMIAGADELAEMIKSLKLTELHGLDAQNLLRLIVAELGEIPLDRNNCLKICIDTLSSALADFRAYQLETFQGEKALICTCFGVTEEEVEALISREAIENIEDITTTCKAGGGCGSCQPIIQELLDIARTEKQN